MLYHTFRFCSSIIAQLHTFCKIDFRGVFMTVPNFELSVNEPGVSFLCDCWYSCVKVMDAFGSPHALRSFICTDCSLSTREILDLYLERWLVEVFFRQAKQKLAIDKLQIRTSIGSRRYWLLMSLAHYICCCGTRTFVPFQDGLAAFQTSLRKERITCKFQCGVIRKPLDYLLAFVA